MTSPTCSKQEDALWSALGNMHGWYAAGAQWKKLAVDANGKLVIAI